MVTQGTNDGGSNTNRNRSGGSKSNHAGYQTKGGVHGAGRNGGHSGDRYESKGTDRTERHNDRGPRYTKNDGAGGGQMRYSREDGNRTNRPYDKGRGFNSSQRFSGKDEDDEDKGRRSKPSHPKENKSGAAIPDKNKVMLRLEKEQKSMKKKQNRKKESSRPQPRVKRSNNVNYTKNYANGDYDDYEDYYDY